MRDPRPIVTIDLASPNRLVPSCNTPGPGVAFAPPRILETGRELDRAGARVGVGSVCQTSYAFAFDSFAVLLLE